MLNAVVGFAGLAARRSGRSSAASRSRSRTRRASSPPASSRSRRGSGAEGCCSPSTASTRALFQCLEGRRAETRRLARADRVRRPVPRPHAGRARRGHARGGARTSDLADGPKDHCGLRDAREQGARADRGALPLRRSPTSGSRSSSTRPRSSTALVRFRDGASLAHLGYPDMRVPISFALTYPERAATPVPPLDLSALTLEFEAPDLETFPLLALAREAGERGGTYPCAYNAANEVAVAGVPRRPDRVPRDRRRRRGRARAASTARPPATSTS